MQRLFASGHSFSALLRDGSLDVARLHFLQYNNTKQDRNAASATA